MIDKKIQNFAPITQCTKNLSDIKSYTTDTGNGLSRSKFLQVIFASKILNEKKKTFN